MDKFLGWWIGRSIHFYDRCRFNHLDTEFKLHLGAINWRHLPICNLLLCRRKLGRGILPFWHTSHSYTLAYWHTDIHTGILGHSDILAFWNTGILTLLASIMSLWHSVNLELYSDVLRWPSSRVVYWFIKLWCHNYDFIIVSLYFISNNSGFFWTRKRWGGRDWNLGLTVVPTFSLNHFVMPLRELKWLELETSSSSLWAEVLFICIIVVVV